MKSKTPKTPKAKATMPAHHALTALPKPKNAAEAKAIIVKLVAEADALRAERRNAGLNRSTFGTGQLRLKQVAHYYRRLASKYDLSEMLPEFHKQAVKANEPKATKVKKVA